jgi:hypothetical protein
LASSDLPRRWTDPDRLDTRDPEELIAWTRRLGVTAEELLQAVATAGNHVLNLREHFNLRRP